MAERLFFDDSSELSLILTACPSFSERLSESPFLNQRKSKFFSAWLFIPGQSDATTVFPQ